MTTSLWSRPHSFKVSDVMTDVLIIGGGYAGLSTAYWLTEMKPDLKITIIERQNIGAGASGRNAGFLTKGSAAFYKKLNHEWGTERAKKIFHFADQSIEMVHQQILKSSPEIKFEKTTSLTLLTQEATFNNWKEDNFKANEFNFDWISHSQLAPALNRAFFGAYEVSQEFKINPIQLLQSLKKKLESRKVQIIEGVSAFDIQDEVVYTETNIIKAKQVVVALNGYLPQFHQLFKNVVTPQRAQMLAVELGVDVGSPSLHYDPEDRVYWRKSQDNLLLIGGKRLLDEKEENGDFEKLNPVIQNGLENYLKEKIAIEYKVIHRWSGIMGFTKNELPIISRMKNSAQTFVIGGFSGHGMGLGFHCAKEMAEMVCGLREKSFFSDFER
jgi:glycine/D-amino acid oxidase-like deaminating enzyme